MEYKICENCGAKLHSRTMKCPICNILLTEASKITTDEVSSTSQSEIIGENIDIKISDSEIENNTEKNDTIQDYAENIDQTSQQQDVKDYVYKAEVRHSLEYTNPLSNSFKVFLTAFSMIPLLGQFIGTFLGIFYSTYDDNDRKSFGKALIFLSIIMFMFYSYSLMISTEILKSGNLNNYLNNF